MVYFNSTLGFHVTSYLGKINNNNNNMTLFKHDDVKSISLWGRALKDIYKSYKLHIELVTIYLPTVSIKRRSL